MNDGLYAEAKQTYDLAFTEDRYILPSHLSTVAMKMMGIHNDAAALDYLSHRVRMEPDFYEEPTASTFPQLRDTFEVCQRKWGYDLDQKQYLEWIFERDNYDRMLWFLAANKRAESPERVEKLSLTGLLARQRVATGGWTAADGDKEIINDRSIAILFISR